MPSNQPAYAVSQDEPPSERGGFTLSKDETKCPGPDQSPCADCGNSTTPCSGKRGCRHIGRWEYYMVHDEVWREAGMTEGFLCIRCLEVRLYRLLTPFDFTDAPINAPNSWDTPRLLDRKIF